MIETIIAGIILALISGITVFAFKQKLVFDKLFDKLLIIIFVIFVILVIWTTAIQTSFTSIYQYIEKDKIEIAEQSLPNLPFNNLYLFIVFFAIQIYLNILKYLTNLVDDENKK